jgi:hypothetical protein
MTPAALSALIFRFIALAVCLCGIGLIVNGAITHVGANKMRAQWAALYAEQHPENPNLFVGVPFAKVAGAFYIGGGATVLVGSFLFLGSRRLGALMARDL